MRLVLQITSSISLAGTILPSILFLAGRIDLDQTKWWMLIATIVWFIATSLGMGRPKIEDELVI